MDGPVVTNIEKIARAAQLAEDQLREKSTEDVGGVLYWRHNKERVVHKLPSRSALSFTTLAGLVDYLVADPDKVLDAAKPVIVQIVSHTRVDILGPVRDDDVHSRETYAVAKYEPPKPFTFGTYYEREAFNIALMSQFDQEQGDWAAVLALVSNVVDETSVALSDNGVTQEVVARSSVAGAVLGRQSLPNPITLAPFRSFPDIEQAQSKLVIRCARAEGQAPKFALFEADGGEWAMEAKRRISEILVEGFRPLGAKVIVVQ